VQQRKTYAHAFTDAFRRSYTPVLWFNGVGLLLLTLVLQLPMFDDACAKERLKMLLQILLAPRKLLVRDVKCCC